MYKSCSICGKIHRHSEICPNKIYKKRDGRKEDTFRASQLWKNKREEIKERDKFCCLYCKYIANEFTKDMFNWNNLSVHHIIPLTEDFDRRLDNYNLITLCRAHHEEAEKGFIERRALFEAVLKVPPGG